MYKKLVIFGCGGHAKSVADVVLFNEPNISITFVDENAKKNETILGFPVLKKYDIENEDVFIAIGNNSKRRKLCELHYSKLISIISSRAYIGRNTNIGKGVFIAHDSHIGVYSNIKDFALINTMASIDHECIIGIATSIAPGVVLCGKVTIGDECLIGACSSVRNNIFIENKTIIGMGAIVVNNISEGGAVYLGVPAKLYNRQGQDEL